MTVQMSSIKPDSRGLQKYMVTTLHTKLSLFWKMEDFLHKKYVIYIFLNKVIYLNFFSVFIFSLVFFFFFLV